MRGRGDAGVDLCPVVAGSSSGPAGFSRTDAAAPARRSRTGSALRRRAGCGERLGLAPCSPAAVSSCAALVYAGMLRARLSEKCSCPLVRAHTAWF